MTGTPTNVINMQARARLIREAQEAREKRKADRDESATNDLIAFTAKGDPDFPGIPELAHFYKPPGTCEICGSVSPPNTKVCLACAVASEVDNMGV